MIRHDDKGIKLDGRKSAGERFPYPANHHSRLIRPHLLTQNVTEQTQTVLYNDGHKVGARLRVVMAF